MPKSSKVNKKSYVLAFFHIKASESKFDLTVKRSRSTQCYNLKNSGSKHVPDAIYQVARPSAYWFWRRDLKVFTIYVRGGHVGHLTRTV